MSSESDTSNRLRVLISAYACEPGKGSEGGVGWNVVRKLAQKHDLWVLTRANNREGIEREADPLVEGVRFVYVDLPKWMRFWKRGHRGTQLYYFLWQIAIVFTARRLMKRQSFDLIHHLTFGRYWSPSRLAYFDTPFVYGSVGGGEATPKGFHRDLGFRGRLVERTRDFIRGTLRFHPLNLLALRRAKATIAATSQTAERLERLGVPNVQVLPQSGISEEELARFEEFQVPVSEREPLVVSACRQVHWKGLHLGIEAVARVAGDHPELRYKILSEGPERPRLERLAQKLGVTESVIFTGRLPTLDDVTRTMASARLFVHPALHEAFGQACLESIALGTPVVCLDWGGPGMIVNPECGFPIEVRDRESVIEGLADAIRLALVEPERLEPMSAHAIARAREHFTWNTLCENMDAVYRSVAPSRTASS